MSYPGQAHHPHTPGGPPNSALIGVNQDGSSYIPAGLELVQAHWFVRHGERSPVRKRLAGHGDIPSVYSLCSISRQFSTSVLTHGTLGRTRSFDGQVDNARGFQSSEDTLESWKGAGGLSVAKGRMEILRLSEEQGEGNTPVAGTSSDCYWGELTDLGRQSTLTLGGRLRSIYVDQLNFLPPVLPNLGPTQSPVSFRSTGMPRTIESLHQIVQGLFPERDGPVNYMVRNAMEESLYPNSMCPKLRRLDEASAKQAAIEQNPTLEKLDAVIGKYNNGPVRLDGHPRASGLLDTIMVTRAHNIRVPPEFEDREVLETLEKAVVHEWFDAYKSKEFSRLSMGRLLGDLKATMARKVDDPSEKKEKLRLAVYSAHDTSLGGILNALKVFDNRWPPFTSHISFELLRDSSPASSWIPSFFSRPAHYVRMRYNGKPLTIPQCAPTGKHLPGSKGEVCSWDAFLEAVKEVEMTAKDWECDCV